jgi:hypothetical protein
LKAIMPHIHFTAVFVMPGLDPGIHLEKEFFRERWIAGSSPAMTSFVFEGNQHDRVSDIALIGRPDRDRDL